MWIVLSIVFAPFFCHALYWCCKLKSFINYHIFLPVGHPKSQPFFDRVYTFSLIDDKIWFRHYQVLPEEDGSLAEIGPRFVLNPIKIFDASFSGATLWESPNFTTPAKKRALLKKMKAGKYIRYVFLEYLFFWNIYGKMFKDDFVKEFLYKPTNMGLCFEGRLFSEDFFFVICSEN